MQPVLVMLALLTLSVASSQSTLNSWFFMEAFKNGASCVNTWNDMKATYYSGANEQCGVVMEKVMKTLVPSQCPEGRPFPNGKGDQPGGIIHNCMTGNGNNTELKEAWGSFVGTCEVFYVAFRVPGESEDGFVANDNSCLRRHNSVPAFKSWLNSKASDAAPASASASVGSSANSVAVKALPMGLAFLAAVLMLLYLQ